MRYVKASVLAAGALLASCGQQSATGGADDPLIGMWSWQSQPVNFTDIVGTWQRSHNGTMLVAAGDRPSHYTISLNHRQTSYLATKMESISGSTQSCTGIRNGDTLAIQCTVDTERYPTWRPADFSFQISGTAMSGALLSDNNAPVAASKM